MLHPSSSRNAPPPLAPSSPPRSNHSATQHLPLHRFHSPSTTAVVSGDHESTSGQSDLAAPATSDDLLPLLRAGRTDDAFAIFSSSPSLPSSVACSRLLAQLSYKKSDPTALPRARQLVSRLRDAGELRRLDSNSLSLLTTAAARAGHSSFSNRLLLSMLRSGHAPHRKAYTTAISRLADPLVALDLFDSVLRFLRSAPATILLSSGTVPDTAAFNAALNACAVLGSAKRFREIFDTMPEFGAKPDAWSYNVVIKMCARLGRRELVPCAVERALTTGAGLCVTTVHSVVAAYVGFGDLTAAERIIQALREGRRDLCLVLRQIEEAASADSRHIGQRTVEKDSFLLDDIVGMSLPLSLPPPLLPKPYKPNSRVYTTLMKGYMNAGRVEDVVRTLRAMRREGARDPASRPDEVTYTTVVSALVGVGDMVRARPVLDDMTHNGVPASRITYNVLLKGYCQQLQLGTAKELLREMSARGIQPDVVSYNTLIDGCVLVDDSSGALSYFNEMRTRGIAPSAVSYTTLMKAFALSGQPKLAHQVFDEMEKDPRVRMDRAAWNMLVEGYCRAGLLEEGKKAVAAMKERGVAPDVATYGSLASGVAVARKPGEALLLWEEVKERCSGEGEAAFRPDEQLLEALAEVFVRQGWFKKALEVVACMEEMGMEPKKSKYKKMYVELHSRMFTSKHASQARRDRRQERKRAAEAFKFWLGLPNQYYGSEWRLEDDAGDEDDAG